MSLADGHISVGVVSEDRGTVTLTIREAERNLLIGYLEIRLVPKGVVIEGTHGLNDTPSDERIVLRAEIPS